MKLESAQTIETEIEAGEIVEIEATELDLREDMSLFLSCCCPCGPYMPPYQESDRRLKVEIEDAGTLANGLNLHSWRYLGGTHRFTGVMADELLANPDFADAVQTGADGMMCVDYGATGYFPADIDLMRVEGEAAMELYHKRLN